MKPEDLISTMTDPLGSIDSNIFDHIHGSMAGLALGDALGAHCEFRPRSYLLQHPVTDLVGGGTWGLEKGQVNYFRQAYLSVLTYRYCLVH
jgi:hypothetical protein